MQPDFRFVIRGLARCLDSYPVLSAAVDEVDDAIRLFVDVAHGGLCPICGARRWRPIETHHIECARCGRVSVFHGTGFRRRRLNVLHLLTAVFAIFVDTSATSSRGFSRRTGLRLETSWKLLHDVRDALPRASPQEPAIVAQVLGRASAQNAAEALLAGDDGRLVAVEGFHGAPPGRGRAELPLWLGRLRAWLTEVFRGVSAKHLWRYLAEFAARHGRVGRRGASHI